MTTKNLIQKRQRKALKRKVKAKRFRSHLNRSPNWKKTQQKTKVLKIWAEHLRKQKAAEEEAKKLTGASTETAEPVKEIPVATSDPVDLTKPTEGNPEVNSDDNEKMISD